MVDDDRSFLGRGWAFPPRFDRVTGTVGMVSEDRDIRESLLILFSTSPGERVMLPEFGCSLHEHVFDGTDDTTLTNIKSLIFDAILFFEPRIKLEDIQFDTQRMPEGALQIILDYTVLTTNSRSNMVIPYYLSEGTNVRAL